jgi:carboxymethylenebutenolidase
VADFDADIRAAVSFLAAHDAVGGAPVGAAGHCTGGHLAFRAAMLPEVRATACWYPTACTTASWGPIPTPGRSPARARSAASCC